MRAWVRTLVGASGLAVLAPAAMLSALAVASLGGGLGGLGSLGQLFSGPSLPASAPLPGARATANALRAAPAFVAATAPGAVAASSASTPVTGGGGGAPGSANTRGTGTPTANVPRGSGQHSQPAAGSPSPVRPAAPQQTHSQPTSQPPPVHQIVEPVRTAVSSVPVVGSPVGNAIKQVENTIEPPAR